MNRPIQLAGIGWDHSRAFPPLLATAQRYEETHPTVRIRWEKRTLDQFGHAPIDQLASRFDLIVIDYPWAGFAFENDLVRDLKPLLPSPALTGLAENSIGATFESYCYAGKLLALPIDAAAPAPSWRPDLLERANAIVPTTWAEAVALAQRKLAVIPAFNADLFLHFLMLVKALGAEPCADPERIAPREMMRRAVELLRELTEPMPREIFDWNPIQIAERLTTTDDFAWNAFAYTYNNYARGGFSRTRLGFGALISLEVKSPPLRSVLGGTGLAISSHCKHVDAALDYARFVADGTTQKTMYLYAGGQPSHRAAWNDAFADELCGQFFSGTRITQEEAFIRPRYRGYVPLQTKGGSALQETLRDGRDAEVMLEKLDALYRQSRVPPGKKNQTNSPQPGISQPGGGADMNLKLSCADFSFPLLPHGAALELIALLELPGADIGLFAGRSHLRPETELRNPAKRGAILRRQLARHGLVAADIFLQVHENFTDYAINHPAAPRRKFARQQFLRTLDYAAAAGPKHITILPGVSFANESRAESLARATEELSWRTEQAAAMRLTLAIEPHLGSIADTPERALELAAVVPRLGFTLDYAHFTRAGISDARIELLGARATHFHARCARKGHLQSSLKENAIDFLRALKALNKNHFTGWMALEYVWIDWEHCNEVDVLSETIQLRDHLVAAAKNISSKA